MLEPSVAVDVRTTTEYRGLREFAEITAHLEYDRLCQVIPVTSGHHVLYHRLNGAILKDYGEFGGSINYEQPIIVEQDLRPTYQKAGLELPEAQFTDEGLMGKIGYKAAGDWAVVVASAAAYWPQRALVSLLRSAYTTTFQTGPLISRTFGNCYDGLPLFSVGHPYNLKQTSLGYFSNFFSGGTLNDGRAASMTRTGYGTCPGFAPLAGPFGTASAEISLTAAWDNLWSVISYIHTIKQPDGVTPRFLRPTTIVGGPKLLKNITTLTHASFVSMNASSSAGGSTEIAGTILQLGLNKPVILDELGGNTDLDADEDYDWYLVCEEQAKKAAYGGLIYAPREPFDLKMYAAISGQTGINLELAEKNVVKWISQGRSGVTVGLPQFIFKVQATRDP